MVIAAEATNKVGDRIAAEQLGASAVSRIDAGQNGGFRCLSLGTAMLRTSYTAAGKFIHLTVVKCL